jgi:hypothetical protein
VSLGIEARGHKTAAEEAWLDEVASIGCVMTWLLYDRYAPAEIHHLFGAHQRSHWLVAPLSPDFHRGPNGFHGLGGEPGFRRRYKVGEAELLAMTIKRVEEKRRNA